MDHHVGIGGQQGFRVVGGGHTEWLNPGKLAGVQAGVFDSLDDVTANWRRERSFSPSMDADLRRQLLAGWTRAVSRVKEP